MSAGGSKRLSLASEEAKALINTLAATPLLSHEEERHMTTAICQTREQIGRYESLIIAAPSVSEKEHYHRLLSEAEDRLTRLRDSFFAANIKLVLAVVSKMSRMDAEDMFQHGAIGLSHAIDLFDPERGGKFSTYANYWIKQAIQRGCDKDESLIVLPVHIRDMLKTLRRAGRAWLATHASPPTLEQLCRATGFQIDHVRAVQMIATTPISLDHPYDSHSSLGEDGTLIDDSIDTAPSALEYVIAHDDRVIIQYAVQRALIALSAVQDDDGNYPYSRHARAIALRYRIGEPVSHDRTISEMRTLAEVGALMVTPDQPDGISPQRTRQLVRAGMQWMLQHVPELAMLKAN